MNKYGVLSAISVLIISTLMGCTIINSGSDGLSEVSITWELRSNNIGNSEHAQAVFSLKNNSKHKLDGKNWKLFFNQAPRPLIENDSGKVAIVEHINGDYYRLVPAEKFILKPGDSIEISYEFNWIMLKETDAPRGLYFVSYNKRGKELGVYPVKNYSIMPIELSSDINLGETGNNYLPSTPEWQYLQNRKIKILPENEWQPLIPDPVKLTSLGYPVTIDSTFLIVCDRGLENESRYLKEMLKANFGLNLNSAEKTGPDGKYITLIQRPMEVNGIAEESYKTAITNIGIEIIGNDAEGVFYGIQSFLSLVPVDRYGKKNKEIMINGVSIEDAPRFPYRGLHIDVGRHFQPKAGIIKILNLMAFYKLNKLHLYLTEDEGWRIEIKQLPELTQIGSRRGHCPAEDKMLNPAYGSGADPENPLTYGSGFYSREDFIEIIRYAQNRHIQVIPSINFPGHARAAIKSMEVRYNRLTSEGKRAEAEAYRLIGPNDASVYISAQFYKDNVVNVALESTYRFYDTVISEIADMYKEADVPFTFIHTGGDEVPNGTWGRLPECIRLMQDLQIKESRDLQSYFTGRMLEILNKYNLTIGGWEEIALRRGEFGEIEVNPQFADKKVVPYVWNNIKGSEDLGYKLANAGYPVVLSCVTNFYLDMAYNIDPLEPGLYWGGTTDEYDPWIAAPYNLTGNSPELVPLKKESRKNILGLQAQLWSETITGSEMQQYYLLPKLISFAEKAWAAESVWEENPESGAKTKLIESQWNQFINAVSQRELPRLNTLFGGFNYRVPPPGAIIEKGTLRANTQYPGLGIYYTTDGTNPDESSMKYTQPVAADTETKLISIDKAGKRSRVVMVKFED